MPTSGSHLAGKRVYGPWQTVNAGLRKHLWACMDRLAKQYEILLSFAIYTNEQFEHRKHETFWSIRKIGRGHCSGP